MSKVYLDCFFCGALLERDRFTNNPSCFSCKKLNHKIKRMGGIIKSKRSENEKTLLKKKPVPKPPRTVPDNKEKELRLIRQKQELEARKLFKETHILVNSKIVYQEGKMYIAKSNLEKLLKGL